MSLAPVLHICTAITYDIICNVCACYPVRLSCSPIPAHKICTTELMLHSQIYDEAYERKEKKRKTDGRIENWTSLDLVWLSEVRVC